LCICENEATLDYRHSSSLKLRNTWRRSLTQGLVGLFSPVVLQSMGRDQTRVAKGQKMCNPQAIPTGVVQCPCFHCLSLSVCIAGKKRTYHCQTNLALITAEIIHTIIMFFIRCLRLGTRGVHQTQVCVVLKIIW